MFQSVVANVRWTPLRQMLLVAGLVFVSIVVGVFVIICAGIGARVADWTMITYAEHPDAAFEENGNSDFSEIFPLETKPELLVNASEPSCYEAVDSRNGDQIIRAVPCIEEMGHWRPSCGAFTFSVACDEIDLPVIWRERSVPSLTIEMPLRNKPDFCFDR